MQYYGSDLEGMTLAKNYYQWVFDEFTPSLKGVSGEIGAGCGNFSGFIESCDSVDKLLLFEPSENMYPKLNKRFKSSPKVTVSNTFFGSNAEFQSSHFNALVYVNVLEHIENDNEALEIALDALVPGGKLLIFVPALPFLFSKFDRLVGHYRRYTKSTLKSVVEDAGFSIRKLTYFDALGILPWFLFFVLLRQTKLADNVSIYDRFAIPLVRRLEEKWPPLLGKNLLLIAEKPIRASGG